MSTMHAAHHALARMDLSKGEIVALLIVAAGSIVVLAILAYMRENP